MNRLGQPGGAEEFTDHLVGGYPPTPRRLLSSVTTIALYRDESQWNLRLMGKKRFIVGASSLPVTTVDNSQGKSCDPNATIEVTEALTGAKRLTSPRAAVSPCRRRLWNRSTRVVAGSISLVIVASLRLRTPRRPPQVGFEDRCIALLSRSTPLQRLPKAGAALLPEGRSASSASSGNPEPDGAGERYSHCHLDQNFVSASTDASGFVPANRLKDWTANRS